MQSSLEPVFGSKAQQIMKNRLYWPSTAVICPEFGLRTKGMVMLTYACKAEVQTSFVVNVSNVKYFEFLGFNQRIPKHVVNAANMITGRLFRAGSKRCSYSGRSFESCFTCVEVLYHSTKQLKNLNAFSRMLF